MKEQKEQKEHQTEIFEYIRRRKGGQAHKIGVIYGTTEGNTIRIGWSKCNVKDGDSFNPDLGVGIAKTRAHGNDAAPSPLCIKRQLRQFGARCLRYFKEANKLELPI